MKQRYDFIVGIGEACVCTESLRRGFLQFESLPFDWVGSSDIMSRVEIIESNFIDYFNPNYMEDMHISNGKPSRLCEIYKNTKYNILFPHEFQCKLTEEENYKICTKQYNRRIKRFYENIENADSVLFVYIERPKPDIPLLNEQDLIDAQKRLSVKFSDKNVNILFYRNDWNVPYKKRLIRKINDNITICSFNYSKYKKDDARNVGKVEIIALSLRTIVGLNLSLAEYLQKFYMTVRLILKKWFKVLFN